LRAHPQYDQYQADVAADIEACVERMGCQPILFLGSGLSKRYFSGPSWDDLLAHLPALCPLIDKEYAYYKQALQSPLAIGAEFARYIRNGVVYREKPVSE
jgi:hypothetical protein